MSGRIGRSVRHRGSTTTSLGAVRGQENIHGRSVRLSGNTKKEQSHRRSSTSTSTVSLASTRRRLATPSLAASSSVTGSSASIRSRRNAASIDSNANSFEVLPKIPEQIDYGNLTVKELKKLLKERDLKVSGRKHELVSRLELDDAEQSGVATKVWKKEKWSVSVAKAILLKCLLDDNSKIHIMTSEQVQDSHPAFKPYPTDRFAANLDNLRASVKRTKETTLQDEKDFKLQQTLFPRSERTSRNKLFWDTHKASSSLKVDVAEGKLEYMSPSELRLIRTEYQDFDVLDFCKYCQQEKRTLREKPYWIPLRNKTGLQKHNEEAEVAKRDFDNYQITRDLKDITRELTNLTF